MRGCRRRARESDEVRVRGCPLPTPSLRDKRQRDEGMRLAREEGWFHSDTRLRETKQAQAPPPPPLKLAYLLSAIAIISSSQCRGYLRASPSFSNPFLYLLLPLLPSLQVSATQVKFQRQCERNHGMANAASGMVVHDDCKLQFLGLNLEIEDGSIEQVPLFQYMDNLVLENICDRVRKAGMMKKKQQQQKKQVK
ncbi:uncharacterized protein DS421_15g493170 [Arachis hypogaea]|nr:uncharacterized protein DS421_15g493170 [Arachis hypogaea]